MPRVADQGERLIQAGERDVQISRIEPEQKAGSFPFIVVLLINGSETSPLFGEVQRGMRLRHTAHTVRVSHIECQSKGVRDEIGCPIGREDPEPI